MENEGEQYGFEPEEWGLLDEEEKNRYRQVGAEENASTEDEEEV